MIYHISWYIMIYFYIYRARTFQVFQNVHSGLAFFFMVILGAGQNRGIQNCEVEGDNVFVLAPSVFLTHPQIYIKDTWIILIKTEVRWLSSIVLLVQIPDTKIRTVLSCRKLKLKSWTFRAPPVLRELRFTAYRWFSHVPIGSDWCSQLLAIHYHPELQSLTIWQSHTFTISYNHLPSWSNVE